MSSPITILKKLGCKVVSRETTPGAQKWWLTYPPERTITKGLVAVGLTLKNRVDYGEFIGEGFELSLQSEAADGHEGFFVAKPRKTKTGREYRYGLDT